MPLSGVKQIGRVGGVQEAKFLRGRRHSPPLAEWSVPAACVKNPHTSPSVDGEAISRRRQHYRRKGVTVDPARAYACD